MRGEADRGLRFLHLTDRGGPAAPQPRARRLAEYIVVVGRLQERWENLYKKACKNGDVKRISRYAASSPDEFFAECFAYRENGGKLPRDYEKVLDNIIQFATKKT